MLVRSERSINLIVRYAILIILIIVTTNIIILFNFFTEFNLRSFYDSFNDVSFLNRYVICLVVVFSTILAMFSLAAIGIYKDRFTNATDQQKHFVDCMAKEYPEVASFLNRVKQQRPNLYEIDYYEVKSKLKYLRNYK